jgi:hypothetical protein
MVQSFPRFAAFISLPANESQAAQDEPGVIQFSIGASGYANAIWFGVIFAWQTA